MGISFPLFCIKFGSCGKLSSVLSELKGGVTMAQNRENSQRENRQQSQQEQNQRQNQQENRKQNPQENQQENRKQTQR